MAQIVAVPTLNTVNPNFGSPNTFVTVTLTGTNFVPGQTSPPAYPVAVSGNGVTVINVTVTATSVTATLAISSTAALGYRQITVGNSNTRTFTILAASSPPLAPVLTAIGPNFGAPGQAVSVTLTGMNFVPEPAVAVSGGGVSVVGPAAVTPTSWSGTLAIAAGLTPGNRLVTLTTAGGTSNPVGFGIADTTPIIITGQVTDAVTGLPIPGAVIADECRQPDAITKTDATGHYQFIGALVPCNAGALALTYSKPGYRLVVRPSFENQGTDIANFFTTSGVANVALVPYRADYTGIARRNIVARSHTDSGSVVNPLDVATFPAGTFAQDDILFIDVITPDGGGDANFGVTLTAGLGTVELLTGNKAGHGGHAQLYGEFSNPAGTSTVSGPTHFAFSHSVPWPGQSVSMDNAFNGDTGQTNWITGSFSLALHHSTTGNPRWFEWQIVRLSRQGLPKTPVLNAVSPNFGSPGAFVDVSLTGANFVPGLSTAMVSGAGVTVTSVNVTAPETLNATLSVSATAAQGYRQIAVMTPAGLESPPLFSNTRTFTVLASSMPAAAPTLSAISRSAGNPGQPVFVTLAGTNFTPESTITISGPGGVSASSLNVVNSTTMGTWFGIDPAAAPGPRTIAVTTPGVGTSNDLPFSVRATITATAGANGSISPSGTVRVDYDSDQLFAFVPSTGYALGTVTVDGSTVSPDSTTSHTVHHVTRSDHTIDVTFSAVADLSITKSDSPDPVNAGSTLTYTLNVSNAGPSTATSVSVTDTLPGDVTFVSATGDGWTCSGTSTVTCTRSSLAPGAAPGITITVTAPLEGGGHITNTASVNSAATDPNPGNNSATQSTAVGAVADLSITKTDSPDPVNAGSTLTYTLSVFNAGPSRATNVTVIDTLPAGVTFISVSGDGWSGSGSLTWTRENVPPGTAAPPITLTVTSPSVGGTLTNTAVVGSSTPDPHMPNNTATEQTTVRSPEPQVFVVNGVADLRDALPGDGACLTATGVCTLRAAVQEANALTTADTIQFSSILNGTPITLTITGSGENAAAAGDLDITGSLTISGNGSGNTVIQACDATANASCTGIDRILDVMDAATLTLNGVTLRNGHVSSPEPFGRTGGAIRVGVRLPWESGFGGRATLIVSNSSVLNSSANGHGGAIENIGNLTLNNSVISGNRTLSNYHGGGVSNEIGGTMTITNSTFSGNSAGGGGGGIMSNSGSLATEVTITGSTINGNSAGSDGGGFFNNGYANQGTLKVTNSSFSGNTATGSGGAIVNHGGGIAKLASVTLSGNSAAQGGGIFNSTPVDIKNTIIATSAGGNCAGTGGFRSGGYNLSGDASCGFAAAGDLNSTNAQLGPLASNGGATLTHTLLAGSPAIDAGNPAGCTDADGATLSHDQRGTGFPRSVDGNSDGVARCDIGAIEGVTSPTQIAWIRQFGTAGEDTATGSAWSDGKVLVTGFRNGPDGRWGEAFVRVYTDKGDLEWERGFGASQDQIGTAVARDAFGNVYVAGSTVPTLPGQMGAGGQDAFLRKYDWTGTEVWTRQFGGNVSFGQDGAHGLALDADGNPIVVGVIQEGAALPGQTSAGGADAFVRKYHAISGDEIWTQQFGTSAHDSADRVAVDIAGNVYVFGRTSGVLGQSSSGGQDVFLRKYDANGTLQWTLQFGTSAQDDAGGVAVDSTGNIIVSGQTFGTFADQASSGGSDLYVRKYDSNRNELWTRQFGTAGQDTGGQLAMDRAGNIFVAGTTSGTFPGQTSSGSDDIFIRKYDGAGSPQWTVQLGSASQDVAGLPAVDTSGRIYVAGFTSGALPDQTPAGGIDAFVVTVQDMTANPRAYTVIASSVWESKTSMTTSRTSPAYAALGGLVYAAGGWNASHLCSYLNTMEAYNPATNSWSSRASMPTARENAQFGVWNGRLYAVGGSVGCGPLTGANESYNPLTNQWTSLAPMPTARTNHAVGVINGVLYAVGGVTVKLVEAYDIASNTWSRKADLGVSRSSPASGVVNGRLYVFGGVDYSVSPAVSVVSVEMYDPATNAWTPRESMPETRLQADAVVHNGIIYIIGGYTGPNNDVVASVLAYDPVNDSWSTMPPMNTARYGLGAAAVGNVLYAFAGHKQGSDYDAINHLTILEALTFGATTGGTISPAGEVAVNSGASQTFTITPYTGYNVTDVLVDGVPVGARTSYTFSNVGSNHTIAASFLLLPPDTTAPTVSLTAPFSGQYLSGTVTITANATDDTSVAGVQFKLDGANLGSEDRTAPFAVSWDTTSTPDGPHTLTAVARDAADNTATSSEVTVTVDNTPPGDPINLSFTVNLNEIALSWVAGEEPNLSGYFVYRCAIAICEETDFLQIAQTTTTSFTDTILTAGTFTYRVRARDAAGNFSGFSNIVTVAGNRAYVANTNGNSVSVIDTTLNSVVTTIAPLSNPYWVALNATQTRAYVTVHGTSSVAVIDTGSNTVVATIPVGLDPITIAVNPSGTRAYTANHRGHNVTVIDTATNTVVATVPVGSNPNGVAINPSGSRAYVTNQNSNSVSVIDTASNTVVTTIPIGAAPYGVAVTPQGNRVYVGNQVSKDVTVIDTASNTVIATIPVGSEVFGVAINPAGTRAYVATGAGNSVVVIDIPTHATVATIPVGSGVFSVAVSSTGTRVYATNNGSATLSVIDAASNTVVATIPVGGSPQGVAAP